jgi:hypothetical protein
VNMMELSNVSSVGSDLVEKLGDASGLSLKVITLFECTLMKHKRENDGEYEDTS